MEQINKLIPFIFSLFLILLLPSASWGLDSSLIDLRGLERVALQSGGRIKPFSSFAREAVVFVTSKAKLAGKNSTALLIDWLAYPDHWEIQPLIPVTNKELREFLHLHDAKRISPKALSSSPAFMSEAEKASLREERGETLTFLEKKTLELYQKMSLFYNSAQGTTWTIVPNPQNPQQRWLAPYQITTDPKFKKYSDLFEALLNTYRKNDNTGFQTAVQGLLSAVPSSRALALEVHYNRLHPFRWSWWFYLAGLLILFFTPDRAAFSSRLGYSGMIAGFIFHTYGFVLRSLIAGRPPVSNMYESVIWVSWSVVLFSLFISFLAGRDKSPITRAYRARYLWIASASVAAFGLILADSLPAALDPSISPLVPVLRSNFWLTIHVLTITLSYGAFALALGIGHLTLFIFAFKPEKESLLNSLTQFSYRSIQIGVILLAAGTILGGVWANYSWGRFWGWDPKETWALIALLIYLAIMHCRFVGWLTPFGLAVGAILAFLGVLMAWYGVNFVLAAGLHSYGFGGGGISDVGAFIIADLLCVAVLSWIYHRNAVLKKA